jgi:Sulfotransferase family
MQPWAGHSYFLGLLGRQPTWSLFRGATRSHHLLRPVFVVGSPRSGTTLVGRMLGAQPAVTCVEESLFLTHLYDLVYKLHFGLDKRRVAPLAHLSTRDLVHHVGELADKLLPGPHDAPGRHTIVDHTPWYALAAPLLDALYPACVFVHVVRSGYDVVQSLGHSYRAGYAWAGRTVGERAEMWRQLVTASEDVGVHVPRERFLRVRYESLVAAPARTMRPLLDGLRLDWDEKVLAPLERPHAGPSRARWNTVRPDAGAPPSDWPPVDVAEFERIAGPTMRVLGYLPTSLVR